MSKIKVVVMVTSPLTIRWESYFCTDALAKVFDLEYWDFSSIASIPFEAKDVLQRSYVTKITSFSNLRSNLCRLPQDVVCLSHIHSDDKRNYKLHKIISEYCKNRVVMDIFANTFSVNVDFAKVGEPSISFTRQKTVKKNIFQHYKTILYNKCPIIRYLKEYIKHKLQGDFQQWQRAQIGWNTFSLYNNYSISMMPGSKYFVNHPDYEKYLQAEKLNLPSCVKGKYVVYLDQYFLHHPHVAFENPGVDFEILREGFYKSLNRFFDKIESTYDYKVVIAAHPVADYAKNPFDGREIIYYKTVELVKHCEAVCMHCSGSVSSVVLYDKPICVISNKYLDSVQKMRESTRRNSECFHVPLTIIDQEVSIQDTFTRISPEVRTGYIKTFFDMSNKKTNKELFIDNIQKIHADILDQLYYNKRK